MKNKYFIVVLVVLSACGQAKKEEEPSQAHADPVATGIPVRDTTTPPPVMPVLPKPEMVKTKQPARLPEESFCPEKGTVLAKEKTQQFYIDTKKDTLLTLKAGTKIFVPQNAFRLRDSTAGLPDKISLNINEFYELDEFMEAGLATTTSMQQLLETGGTVYIQALTENNDTCLVQADKKLEVAFPVKKGKTKKEMDLYKGKTGDDGFVEWDLEQDFTYQDSTLQQRKVGTRYEQFMDGNISLEEYFAKNLFIQPIENPLTEVDHVYINFDVVEQGKVANIHVQGSEDALLTNKITNTVRFMPQWEAFKTVSGRKTDGLVEYRDITMGIGVKLSIDRKKGKVILDGENDTKVAGIARYISMEEFYVFTPKSTLGWLNCDRLFNADRPLATVWVERDTSSKTGVFMVCRNLRGMVRGVKQKNGYKFNGLSEGEYTCIVSIRKSNNKYLLETQAYVCGRGPAGEKNWEWCSKNEMINKVRALWQG